MAKQPPRPFRLLPDTPVGEFTKKPKDGLSFKTYADILARAAVGTPEPFTIGIYGDWGTGKTSMMHMMESEVNSHDNAIGIWFNAWRYEREEHLIIPLLATMITEMERVVASRKESTLWTKTKPIAKSIIGALRKGINGLALSGKIGIPLIGEVGIAVSPKDMKSESSTEFQDQIISQSLYYNAFSTIEKVTEDENCPRLIVLIDDLDRCFPERAVELIEGIKLVLNQRNIAFVIGVAPKIIRSFLQTKYKKEYGIEQNLYEDYLDKIIQLPFTIPNSHDHIENYVEGLLDNKEVFHSLDDEDQKSLKMICGPACKDNPRAIVRFLNRLLIMNEAQASIQNVTKVKLVHFGIQAALEDKWPQVFEASKRNHEISFDDVTEPFLGVIRKTLSEKGNPEALANEFAEISMVKGIAEKTAFEILGSKHDFFLLELLKSPAGIDWISKEGIRNATMSRSSELSWKDKYSVNFSHADLTNALLTNANFPNATFEDAILRDADMRGTNVFGSNFTRADLTGARYNSRTIWPKGFDPKAAGAILVENDE
jgi:Cdc6-like AAA superfamily ATPase